MSKNLLDSLHVFRPSYGRSNPNLPMTKREYRMSCNSPVGTITEIVQFIAKPQGYKIIVLHDLDGDYIYDVESEEISDFNKKIQSN